MRLLITLTIYSLLTLSLSSCVTSPDGRAITSALPSTFTTKNILKVHQGMKSDEILKLFGDPKSVSSAICGRAPNHWKCTTWKYGDSPYDNASFTFSGNHGLFKLNDFDIERN